MWFRHLHFQRGAGGAVVGGGGVDGVGGDCGGMCKLLSVSFSNVSSLLSGDRWSVGVQLRRNALAKMEWGPSCQVNLGAAWRGGGGAQPVGISISRSKLHESSCGGSHSDQFGLWVCPGVGGGGFRPRVFSRHLWAPYTAFMVAACGDHVA